MTPIELAIFDLLVLIGMILLHMPVAVALGLVGYIGYAILEGWTRAGLILGAAPTELAQAYTFSVVPLFTLPGQLPLVERSAFSFHPRPSFFSLCSESLAASDLRPIIWFS